MRFSYSAVSTDLFLLLFTEPEGFHFGELGLAVWRNTASAAAADDDTDDASDVTESATDISMDKIAFGFMTWLPNATLLHCYSESTGDTLDIKLVSVSFVLLLFLNFHADV